MKFEQLNPHSCWTYLIGNEETNKVIVVDPVLDRFSEYIELLNSKKYHLTHVIDTHTHADHISAGSALRDATGCEYIMHMDSPPKCVSLRVKDKDVLVLNGFSFTFLHTPGHTRDSISILVEDKLLTGDFLFLDDAGAGRDDLPGGDPAEHWESLQRLQEIDTTVMIYPAHEYRNRQPSSLGNQQKTNPHLKNRSKSEFIQYIDDLKLGPAEWMKDVLKANYACAQDPNAAWIPLDTPACEIKGTLDKGVNETIVQFITAQHLKQKLAEHPALYVLVDVREKQELTDQLGHIDGIHHIPIASLNARKHELKEYPSKTIVVVCRSGARATTGAQILLKSGFEKVLVLEGGMIAWRR